MAPKKAEKKKVEKKIKWDDTESKRLVRAGIIDESITEEMSLEDIYNLHPEVHGKHPWAAWKRNVQAMRNAIEKEKTRSMEDWLTYKIDVVKLKEMRPVNRQVPWHLSEAHKHLKEDIANGLHEQMKPKELYMTRASYQEFDLKVFRKHIYQRKEAEAKHQWRFEKKLKKCKYPELLKDHPRYPK